MQCGIDRVALRNIGLVPTQVEVLVGFDLVDALVAPFSQVCAWPCAESNSLSRLPHGLVSCVRICLPGHRRFARQSCLSFQLGFKRLRWRQLWVISRHFHCNRHVRFTPETGHLQCTGRCPLWANSEHARLFDHLVGATRRLSNVRQRHIRCR